MSCRPGIIRGMGRRIFIRGIGGVVREFSKRPTCILGRRIEDSKVGWLEVEVLVLAKNPVD